MDLMENVDLDNQMTLLHGTTIEEEEGARNISDKVEELTNR